MSDAPTPSGERTEEEVLARREAARMAWKSARIVGGEPHLEWTFAWHGIRARLYANPEFAYFYEQVRAFEDVRNALLLRERLRGVGAPEIEMAEIKVGFNYFDGAYYSPDGRLSVPAPGEPWRGRHSVPLVGLASEDELLFANSWGPKWADRGIGVMTREYFELYVDHSSVATVADSGLSEENLEALQSTADPDEWLKLWLQPREKHSRKQLHHNFPHDVVTYRAISGDWHCPVDVVEIWADGHRFAWMHLFHPSGYDPRRSFVRELFAMPKRVGLGSLLEQIAVEIATREGSTQLVVEVEEADGSSESLTRASVFLDSRGYDLVPIGKEQRPVVVLRARKQLSGDAGV